MLGRRHRPNILRSRPAGRRPLASATLPCLVVAHRPSVYAGKGGAKHAGKVAQVAASQFVRLISCGERIEGMDESLGGLRVDVNSGHGRLLDSDGFHDLYTERARPDVLDGFVAVSCGFRGFIVGPRHPVADGDRVRSECVHTECATGAPMIYSFEDCELDPDRFELRVAGTPQKIEPQVFEVLCYLVQRPGQFVAKDTLLEAVWRGRVVSDSTIAGAIKAARRAVGDDGTAQRLIRTVHGRGFSFAGPVVATDGAAIVGDAARVAAPLPASPNHAATVADRGAAVLSADVHLCELINGDASAASAESQLLSHRAALRSVLEGSGGRILTTTGGGIAARFDRAEDAMQCAATLQRWGPRAERAAAPEQSARLRVGARDLGADIDRAIGTAGRLQCLASPGEISRRVDRAGGARPAGVCRQPGCRRPGSGSERPAPVDHPFPATASRCRAGGRGPTAMRRADQPRVPSVVILPFQAIGTDELAAELAEGRASMFRTGW